MSNDNVVVGAKDVLFIDFEVETDDVSPVTCDRITLVPWGAGAANFNDNNVSQVKLWR